ncbi:hypothetical protein LZ30DRAFT_594874, partial [Colletotrichum cereale]
YTDFELQHPCESFAKRQRLRQAARTWAVPLSTLRYRLRGNHPGGHAFSDVQRLIQSKWSSLLCT